MALRSRHCCANRLANLVSRIFHTSFVFSPACFAAAICRISALTKRSAFHSSAQPICSESMARNGQSYCPTNTLPIRLTTMTLPTITYPRPGAAGGKLSGRIMRESPSRDWTISRCAQILLPVVITSMPAAYNSRYVFKVMPIPWAEFSPLATTNSILNSLIKPGKNC